MEFRIADTFTDSLGRLTGEEQKAVKTTAFDLQMNPAQPGMQFHKLDKARDPSFWSVNSVNSGDTIPIFPIFDPRFARQMGTGCFSGSRDLARSVFALVPGRRRKRVR